MGKGAANGHCPCGSGVKYKRCCEAFHDGALPENALLLMRSRYCAYALGDADYIVDTTHPDHPEFDADRARWLASIARFSRETAFMGLTVLAFEDGDTRATVTFRAQLRQHGKDASFAEKSVFVKEGARWLYASGEVSPIAAPSGR